MPITTSFAPSLPTLQEMLADDTAVDRAMEQVQQEAKRRNVRPAHLMLFELAALRALIEGGK